MSSVREDYHEELEAGINKQIQMELEASYTYEAMSAYCARHDVALAGFAKHYRTEADEERDHARKFIDYQLKRGATVTYEKLSLLAGPQWSSITELVQNTLDMEVAVYNSIKELCKVANKHCDTGLKVLLEEFIEHQVDQIYEINTKLTILKRVGSGDGLQRFSDSHL
ncbi:hypothetical protein GJ496_006602 [Pomphorhynchus laevis]|nr:hypothetical protein GJ496_006602 [Pomphorhynchus laevis]